MQLDAGSYGPIKSRMTCVGSCTPRCCVLKPHEKKENASSTRIVLSAISCFFFLGTLENRKAGRESDRSKQRVRKKSMC